MFVLFILDQAVNEHFSKNVKILKDQYQSFMWPIGNWIPIPVFYIDA